MREPRIYQPQALQINTTIELDEQGSRHIGTVLRSKPGQPLRLFNGDGSEYQAEVVSADRKGVSVTILDKTDESRASPLKTHLGQCISRGDRMDYALQKAVELGVSEITPLFSERGEVRLSGPRLDKRMQQWQRLVESACEQCGLNVLPQLHRAQTLDNWLAQVQCELKLILHPGIDSRALPPTGQRPNGVALAIGPEGGFSDSEVTQASELGFNGLSLGSRVLRTETAPTVCLTLLQARWGDIAVSLPG